MEGREQRGLVIAATMRLQKNGDKWSVPSQSKIGTFYTVTVSGKATKCTCPDYEAHEETCKHGFAILFTIQREETVYSTLPPVTETETIRVTVCVR